MTHSDRILLGDVLNLSYTYNDDGISIVKPAPPFRDGPLHQLVSFTRRTGKMIILDIAVRNQIVVTACRLHEKARTVDGCGALTFFITKYFQRGSHQKSQ